MAEATKIMLIRHAEKPDGPVQGVDINGKDGKENLTVQGWQRAGALARFFAPASSQFQHPGISQPQFLFASNPVSKKQKEKGGSKSARPQQTITPLSQLIGLSIDLSFEEGSETEMTTAAVACNGVVAIAWQHEEIPAIAAAILGKTGVTPANWPGDRFDVVWIFDLANGAYSFSQTPQLLLAGDLDSVIS